MNFYEFIGVQEKAISLNQCNNIIDFFESNSNLQHFGYVTDTTDNNDTNDKKIKIDFSIKKSLDISRKFSFQEIPENIISKCLQTYMPLYENKFNSLQKIEKWKLCDEYNIRKYEPEMSYFAEHCEMHGIKSNGNRLMSWMIYLNDVFDGGETEFKYQNLKFTPRFGSLLVWPSYWTHPHKGIVSKEENKYITTGWFIFY